LDLATIAVTRFAGTVEPVVRGIGASGGVAAGRAAFDSAAAERLASHGDPVILIRPDTSTTDIAGFQAALGIVTATGGMTAHASLVARQMGKPCVVGCEGLAEFSARGARLAGHVVEEGDWISVDGDSGGVFLGQREILTEQLSAEVDEVERWRTLARTVQLA
jgi:pyruvate,orthophosphate dikinase